MYRFELPDIGEGVVEAEVIEWRIAEGDALAEDQVFVELMTDKATIEIPSPRAGRVHKLCFGVGDIVPVGAVLIEIDTGATSTAAPTPSSEGPPPSPSSPSPESVHPAPAAASQPAPAPEGDAHPPALPPRPGSRAPEQGEGVHGVRAVPAVRELARELGVDLEQVLGSGPGGRIMRRDVEHIASGGGPIESPDSSMGVAAVGATTGATAGHGAAAQEPPRGSSADAPNDSPPNDPPDWERTPLRGMRRRIARHMLEARHRAAHFTYVDEVDLTHLLAAREDAVRAQKLDDVSPLAFIARAVVRALPDYPLLNASIDDARQEIVRKQNLHLGIAVASGDDLLVPVIENAALLSTIGLAHAIGGLAERAHSRELTPAELKGSTFTITSLGKLGGIVSTPILNHPESAILAVNAIRELPRYVDGELQPRSILNLSVSVDHRIADGLMAANFIQSVRRILESADFPDLFSA